MAGVVRVSERSSPVPFGAGADVDSEPGVARGVIVCGLESANGRDYPPDVLRRAVAKYEGVQVYLDHGEGRRHGRGVREWFGELRNVRSRADGRPEADLHYPADHPFAAEFKSRARHFPRSLGLSHVARCEVKRAGGRDRVESIEGVESVDLVASPATVGGLYESVEGETVGSTLRTVLEALEARLEGDRRRSFRKALVEQDGLGVMDAPADVPPDAADPDQAIDDAFRQAMHAQIDALIDGSHTLAELISKIRELGKAHAKLAGGAAPAEEPAGEELPMESKAPADGLVYEALAECEAAGVPPKASLLKVLARLPEKSDRAAVLAEARAARLAERAERPTSAGRHGAARLARQDAAVAESRDGDGAHADGWRD